MRAESGTRRVREVKKCERVKTKERKGRSLSEHNGDERKGATFLATRVRSWQVFVRTLHCQFPPKRHLSRTTCTSRAHLVLPCWCRHLNQQPSRCRSVVSTQARSMMRFKFLHGYDLSVGRLLLRKDHTGAGYSPRGIHKISERWD